MANPNNEALYSEFLKAVDADETPSRETLKAVALLMRAELPETRQEDKPKRGRPPKKWEDYRHPWGAASEVEVRKVNGETYAKARAEVSAQRGVCARILERMKKLEKNTHLMCLPMSSWDTLGKVRPGSFPPFPDGSS